MPNSTASNSILEQPNKTEENVSSFPLSASGEENLPELLYSKLDDANLGKKILATVAAAESDDTPPGVTFTDVQNAGLLDVQEKPSNNQETLLKEKVKTNPDFREYVTSVFEKATQKAPDGPENVDTLNQETTSHIIPENPEKTTISNSRNPYASTSFFEIFSATTSDEEPQHEPPLAEEETKTDMKKPTNQTVTTNSTELYMDPTDQIEIADNHVMEPMMLNNPTTEEINPNDSNPADQAAALARAATQKALSDATKEARRNFTLDLSSKPFQIS